VSTTKQTQDVSHDLRDFLRDFVEPLVLAQDACAAHKPPYTGSKWEAAVSAYTRARNALRAQWARITGVES
jgi:hypothetical protein